MPVIVEGLMFVVLTFTRGSIDPEARRAPSHRGPRAEAKWCTPPAWWAGDSCRGLTREPKGDGGRLPPCPASATGTVHPGHRGRQRGVPAFLLLPQKEPPTWKYPTLLTSPPARKHTHSMSQKDPLAAIHAAIDKRRFGARMKQALHDLLGKDGGSYRIAAWSNGVDHRELHRNAKTVPGLREAHLRTWRDWWGDAFPTMWKHHLEKPDQAA